MALLAPIAALAGCQSSPTGMSVGAAPFSVAADARCATNIVALDTDFEAGNIASCEATGETWLTLRIEPEDEPPINCSAWYAFRLTRAMPGPVDITLDYAACGHRYLPKLSEDGIHWRSLTPDDLKLKGDDDERATFRVEVGDKPLFVAGQELFTQATHDAALEHYAMSPAATIEPFAQSVEGRPIRLLRMIEPGAEPREVVVLVGRQHPPEVTGAQALDPFVRTLLGDSDLAKAYRTRFETIVIPLLNPDGVAKGHWRHNVNGKDLNRDWGPFTQPETRAVGDMLKGIAEDPNRQLRLFLDFHSTARDVFYTIPDTMETDPPLFLSRWLTRYGERMPGYYVNRDTDHNAGLPTSKAYVYETYGVPTATFELGDEDDRAMIQTIGEQAALAMMEEMLASPTP